MTKKTNHNWQTKKLGEVLKLEYGKPLPKSKRKDGGLYPVYGANGEKDRTDEYYHDKQSIIVGRKGSAGEINLTEKKFWPLDVSYFVTFDYKKYDLNFLYYLLGNLELPKLAKGVKPGINRNEVYSIDVQIPPLPEQQRIVAILDEAFAAIATAKENAEKNLQNARELFESYLQSVFANPGDGWEEKKLGECFKLKSGDNLISKMMTENGKFPVYGGNGITGMYDNFNLSGNNIIVGRVGALCGNVRYIKDKIWLTDNAFKITDWKYDFDHAFLAYLLNFKNLRGYARQAAQPVISNSSLEGVLLQFPKSNEEQKRIVAKLDALSAETKKLEAIYRQKLADLDELKKSVLQKAFTGQLTMEN